MGAIFEKINFALSTPRLTKERVFWLFAVFAAFVITAEVGFFLYRDVGTSPAMIWAPIGIAFAAVILGGYAMLPVIFLGTVVAGIMNDTPGLVILVSAAGNTLQPAVAAYFLKRFGFNRQLSRVKDMFLILLVSLFVTMIVPTFNVGGASLYNILYNAARPTFWLYWWVGGALSALILTPLLIRGIPPAIAARGSSNKFEIAAILSLVGVLSYFLFGTTYVALGGFSLFYPWMLLFVWAAFRAGPRFMAIALFEMTVISLFSTVYGTHPPPIRPLNERLFTIEAFDLVIAVIFFMLVSVEEQRKEVLYALKENTLRLETALEGIREKDEAKNEFIAILAHELRNPLATLLSSAELLSLDQRVKGESRELVDIMHSRILTMSRLLNDLLDIARITRKELTIHKETADLAGIVRRALETVGHAIQKKQQTLGVSLPIEPVTLEADPTRIEQALVNLLYNAVKYTPPGGHIDVTARAQHAVVSISVSDSGVGIPENMLVRIFDPFVQVVKDAAGHREGVGTGLGIGLSLTKNLIELHGGSIEARKNPEGKGSEFIVKLPIATNDLPTKAPSAVSRSPLSPISTKKTKNGLEILVVDDNVAAAEGIGKLLALKGHRVSIATSGKDAIEGMPRMKPHAILLDLGLGDMDGCDVAREIRKDNTESVLIALTGYGQAKDKERTEKAGFAYHMTKPVGLADLEMVLAEVAAL